MTKRISLREFQEGLARRLKAAEAETGTNARLSFEAGGQFWLVSLAEAGEVLPVPAIERVPLTRNWFVGVANLRGVLYGITDLSVFLGGPPTPRTAGNRLLLVGQPSGINAALLVTRLTGLRNVTDLALAQDDSAQAPWVAQIWRDAEGTAWRSLDTTRLLAHRDFLEVALH